MDELQNNINGTKISNSISKKSFILDKHRVYIYIYSLWIVKMKEWCSKEVMSILSYFAQEEDKMLLCLLEFRRSIWELSINTILIVDHWTCIWYHWAGVSWHGRMNHNIIFWVCCYLILSLSLSLNVFFFPISKIQNVEDGWVRLKKKRGCFV